MKTKLPAPTIEDHERLAQAIRELNLILLGPSFNGRYLKSSAVFRSFRQTFNALENLKSAMDSAFISENPDNRDFVTSPYYNQGKRIIRKPD